MGEWSNYAGMNFSKLPKCDKGMNSSSDNYKNVMNIGGWVNVCRHYICKINAGLVFLFKLNDENVIKYGSL